MARRGAWQLKNLVITYCDQAGSSKGTREFLNSWLPRFKEQNPHLQVTEVLRRGGHPFLQADYVNGNSRSVTLRNHPPEEILRQAVYLRSATGRKASLQVKQRTKTQTPSIQGHWTPQLQDILRGKASPSS